MDNDLGVDFQEVFLRRRNNLRPFQTLYEKRRAKATSAGDKFPNRNLSVTKAGQKHEFWAPDAQQSNEYQIEHTLECPDRKTNIFGNGWELKFDDSPDELILRYSKQLYERSDVLRMAIHEYQGFWRVRVSNLEWASSKGDLFPGSVEVRGYDSREYPLDLNVLEFLVPGLGRQLVEEFERTDISANIVREQLVIRLDGPSEKWLDTRKADKFRTMQAIVLTILDQLNRFRTECVHPSPVNCELCGDLLEPDLGQNATFMLPENYCSWCVVVLYYHDELALLYEGFSEDELRADMIASFSKLVELSGFPYWKTPILSKDLMIELNLRGREPEEAKAMAHLFASMPKRSTMKKLFESPQHFFHAAGLEALIPRGKGRGIRSISRCGHLCLSMGEREICEYLHENGVSHTKEPLYADLVPEGSEFGAMRGDFLVGDLVIEFAGLDGDEAYDAKMSTKQSLAEKYGLKLIVVRPSDVKKLSDLLALPLI